MQFQVEQEETGQVVEHPSVKAKEQKESGVAIQTLLLLLKTMSQRTLIAASNLFTLAAVGSVFWLWLQIIAQPSINQLIGGTIYGVLVLAYEFIRRR
jgi:hypothetical protein